MCLCVGRKVGLAVGDTAEEKDKATLTRTRLQVEFILELEAMSAFLRGQMRPKDNRCYFSKKVRLVDSLPGLPHSVTCELHGRNQE